MNPDLIDRDGDVWFYVEDFFGRSGYTAAPASRDELDADPAIGPMIEKRAVGVGDVIDGKEAVRLPAGSAIRHVFKGQARGDSTALRFKSNGRWVDSDGRVVPPVPGCSYRVVHVGRG